MVAVGFTVSHVSEGDFSCGLPILDGEVVALDPEGRQDSAGSITVVSRVFAVEGRGRDLFAAAERLDLEGIVAKRKADPCAPSTVWYKLRTGPTLKWRGEANCSTVSRAD